MLRGVQLDIYRLRFWPGSVFGLREKSKLSGAWVQGRLNAGGLSIVWAWIARGTVELSKRRVMSRYRAAEEQLAGAFVDADYARKRQVNKMARSEQVQDEAQRVQITRGKDKSIKWRVASRYRTKRRECKLRAIKG